MMDLITMTRKLLFLVFFFNLVNVYMWIYHCAYEVKDSYKGDNNSQRQLKMEKVEWERNNRSPFLLDSPPTRISIVSRGSTISETRSGGLF
ncbi:hypothetical protein NC652_034557 [Populus alba x Populus x berolinensis]|nr:hypothetical protein NC652_034557 [Populus alba x Populus x berolinensis]